MQLTKALREWALANLGLKADASDDEIKAALQEALKTGKLGADELLRLSKEPDASAALKTAMGEALSPLTAAMAQMAESQKALASVVTQLAEKKPDAPAAPPPVTQPKYLSEDEIQKQVEEAAKRAIEKIGAGRDTMAEQAILLRAMGGQPRIKTVTEMYDNRKSRLVYPERTKAGTCHPHAGQEVFLEGRPIDDASSFEKAVIGAIAKWQLFQSIGKGASVLTDHERDLIEYALREMTWRGTMGANRDMEGGQDVNSRRLTDMERKSLINDSGSGGSYVVPDVFDDMLIISPQLYGELFPLVPLVTLSQGSTVDGATMSNLSWTSNHTEGVAMNLTSTTGFFGNLDTTIRPAYCWIELGLDWESDTPINVGQAIITEMGIGLLVWLDEQVAIGDGTTEPTGIFTASGVNSVSHGATGSAFTPGDFEKLMFGTSKAMRASRGGRNVFVTTDTMYRRACSTPVGAADARRVMKPDMNHGDYRLMGYDVKIQNSISDGSVAFWNPGWYRMYRRQGMTLRVVTEGQTLALKNTRLIGMRARFGGQPQLGSSICKMTDGPQTG